MYESVTHVSVLISAQAIQDKVRNLTGLTALSYTHDHTLVEAIAHREVLFLSQHANGSERGFLYADNATHHNRVPTMSLYPLNR